MGPSWINLFVQHIPQVLDWFEICGIWRPNQHLELIVVLLKSFLNHFGFVAEHIILLKEDITIREYHFQDEHDLQQYLGKCYV